MFALASWQSISLTFYHAFFPLLCSLETLANLIFIRLRRLTNLWLQHFVQTFEGVEVKVAKKERVKTLS